MKKQDIRIGLPNRPLHFVGMDINTESVRDRVIRYLGEFRIEGVMEDSVTGLRYYELGEGLRVFYSRVEVGLRVGGDFTILPHSHTKDRVLYRLLGTPRNETFRLGVEGERVYEYRDGKFVGGVKGNFYSCKLSDSGLVLETSIVHTMRAGVGDAWIVDGAGDVGRYFSLKLDRVLTDRYRSVVLDKGEVTGLNNRIREEGLNLGLGRDLKKWARWDGSGKEN